MLKPLVSAVVIAAIALVPTLASAQSKAAEPASVRRPYRGIFGAPPGAESPQSLTLTGSLFGAYDDNIVAGMTNRRTRDPFLQQSGAYAGVDAGLEYSLEKKSERFSLNTAAGALGRYTQSNHNTSTTPYGHADLQMDWHVSRSTVVSGRQSTTYASRYNFAYMPRADEVTGQDVAFMANPDFDLFGLPALRSTSGVMLTQQLGGKNTTVAGGYIYRVVNVIDSTEPDARFHDYRTQTGLFRFNHSQPVSAHAELQLGYGLRLSDRRSGTGEPRMMQTVNAGINYSRALSLSRRTSLRFSTGSAILNSQRLEDGSTDSRPRVRLIGDASLVREMGRSWTAHLSYARALRARDGFGQLYFTDTGSAAVDGLITRRLSWTSAATVSRSTLDRAAGNGHRGQSLTSQATYALNPMFGLFARYVYYKYRFDEAISLDARLPRQLDRHGIRIGLTTSVPLIR